MSDAIDTAIDLFASFAQLWAVVEVTLTFMQPNYVPDGTYAAAAWLPLVTLTCLLPSKRTFGAALALHIYLIACKMPCIFDSAHWAMQTDAVLLAAILLVPRRAVVPAVEWVVRTQMGLFYIAAGFWKINTSFLDRTVSCAPIFTLSLAAYLPEGTLPPPLVHALAVGAPWMTIVGEMAIGALLLLPFRAARRMGVLLCAVLHLGITLTPFPNQIASFSAFGLSRMFYVLAPSWAAAQAEATSVPSVLPSTGAGLAYRAVAVACTAASARLTSTPGVSIDWAIVLYVGLLFIVARALVIDCRSAKCFLPYGEQFSGLPLPRERRYLNALSVAVGVLALLVAFAYAFLGPVVGLIDVGAAYPFSSIRVHGGSNHLMVPTGMLQAYAAEPASASPAAQVLGRVAEALLGADGLKDGFGGGVVRVEASSSVRLNALAPAEVSTELSPRVRELLQRSGHIGRQFNPTVRHVFGHEVSVHMPRWDAASGTPFVAFTVPALELRRLLQIARGAQEPFTLTYVRLPGALGDNAWRANASGPRISLSEDGRGGRRCLVDGGASVRTLLAPFGGTLLGLAIGGSACDADEIALLPPPPRWLGWLALFFPLPVLNHDELPCMD